MKKIILSISLLVFCITFTYSQVLTKEDSLNNGLVEKNATTVISGYGEAKYNLNLKNNQGQVNLTRNVLFLGHKFNNEVSFFSELEIEDAKVEGGEAGGEVAMEQLFIKFNLNKSNYLVAGLFIPRIGIINENHLPTTYNGNDRPYVERLIIPATWRELGVGLYGNSKYISGLNYSVAILNGLNSEEFSNGSGIRGGRFEGHDASASSIAVTGSLLYYWNSFRIQTSAYLGGSAGVAKKVADSLLLTSGAFGTPVIMNEINLQYQNKGWTFKTLAVAIQIPDASEINRAYANNTPNLMTGAYAELAYDLLSKRVSEKKRKLDLFARYEMLNTSSKIPTNGIQNDINKQNYLITGLTYTVTQGVVVKMDYTLRTTGKPNPALVVNPFPTDNTYFTTNDYINIGIGYSF